MLQALTPEPGPTVCVLALTLALTSACGAARASGRYDGQPLPPTVRIDRLVVRKGEHRLESWANNELQKTYRVAIGRGGAGPKRWEGDGRTPEGRYRIDGRHRSKQYHLFLHVSYPSDADRAAHAEARRKGLVPAGKGIGGSIGLHGEKRSWRGWPHKWVDWTQGCVALDDEEIEELYRAVRPGALLEILP